MIRFAVGTLLGVLLGYLIARRPRFRLPPTYISLHTAEPSKTVTYDGCYSRQSVSWSRARDAAKNVTTITFGEMSPVPWQAWECLPIDLEQLSDTP